METVKLSSIKKALTGMGYRIFTGAMNVNIGGIRSKSVTPNKFDDWIYCFYELDGVDMFHLWEATTDPGLFWLKYPENIKGTAILKPGQYLGAFALDYHQGSYIALCQRLGPVTVIRDNNRNEILDFDAPLEETGFFGINIHRASSWRVLLHIDRYSAGCQVFRRPSDFKLFIQIVQEARKLYGNKFSYTLLTEHEIEQFDSNALSDLHSYK